MNLARYRKALAVGALGVVQVAAYIAADPRDLPPGIVAAAAAINTIAVWWVRNAPAVRSRADLLDHLPQPTRAAAEHERPRRKKPPPFEAP